MDLFSFIHLLFGIFFNKFVDTFYISRRNKEFLKFYMFQFTMAKNNCS